MHLQRSVDALRNAKSRNLLLFGILVICAEFYILGPYSFVWIKDNGDTIVPSFLAIASTGEAGYWFPFAQTGADRLALAWFGGFDSMLFYLFPGWVALNLLTVLQYLSAGMFAFLICRDRLGVDRHGAVIAGLMAALAVSGRLDGTALAYFSLLLWSLTYALSHPNRARGLAVALAVAIFYAANVQVQRLFPWPFAAVGLWVLIVESRSWLRGSVIVALQFAAALALRHQDVLALIAHAPLSGRSDWNLRTTQVQLGDLVNDFIGATTQSLFNFMIAIVICRAFLIGAWRIRTFRRIAICAFAVIAIQYLAEFLAFLFTDLYPPLAGLQFLFSVPASILFVLLAAYGLSADTSVRSRNGAANRWWRKNLFIRSRGPVIVATVVVIVVQGAIWKARHLEEWIVNGGFTMNFRSPVIERFAGGLRDAPPFRVTLLNMHDSQAHAYGLETLGGYLTVFPRRYREFWGALVAPMKESQPDQYAVATGVGDSRHQLFTIERKTSYRLADYADMELLSLANTRFVLSKDALEDEGLVPVVEPAAPWNSRSSAGKIKLNIADNFHGRRQLYIYENMNAFPRWFVAGKVRTFESDGALLAELGEADMATLRATAFVRSGSAATAGNGPGAIQYDIKLDRYAPDTIRLTVTMDGKGVLVVTNSFSPFWKASVNGSDTAIFPVDHAFWGVAVEAGTSKVEFRYEPPYPRYWSIFRSN